MKTKAISLFLFAFCLASLNARGDEDADKRDNPGASDPASNVSLDKKVKTSTETTLSSLADDRQEDPVKRDLKAIQGSWKLVALEVDGEQAPPEIVAALKFVFENDTLAIIPGEPGWTNYKYTLDPTTKPPGFTMSHVDGPKKGETGKGFYSLEGHRLKICLGEADEIPTEFTAKAGSGQGIYSLEREKAGAVRAEGDAGTQEAEPDGTEQPATGAKSKSRSEDQE